MIEKEMARRLAEFIAYAGKPSRVEFADACGWSKQYLNKLLNGQGFGLSAVRTLAHTFPELNIRWLVTGVGNMVDLLQIATPLRSLLRFERYIPVMTDDERAKTLAGHSWNADDVRRFEAAIQLRENEINKRFARAYERQKNAQNVQNMCK